MPIVTIKMVKGRSIEQKKKLVASVTRAVAEAAGVEPAKIWVHIDEFEPHDFSTGGQLLSERS